MRRSTFVSLNLSGGERGNAMLGIPDPMIWSAYLLCIIFSIVCVIFGILKWNSTDDSINEVEDRQWAEAEDKMEENL